MSFEELLKSASLVFIAVKVYLLSPILVIPFFAVVLLITILRNG